MFARRPPRTRSLRGGLIRRAGGAPVCLLAYEGKHGDSAGLRPISQALVRLPGEVMCGFHAGHPAEEDDVLIRVNPTRAGILLHTGLDAPLRSPATPGPDDFVRLCRDLA
ncbi:hypothetical protein [Rubellimicrobium roseum]|uniref:Uncharacterized protein n=1 Tax=Rubellimicrobium roseum TaxID=687525 RepID=A0A5C4NE79_9RHOB|nr:hypothetical protein [Rubellimicrobium roseum]TNC72210.1 hypothetical protein FHG71_09190 [Rubellimicrobium roseum]